MFPKLKVRNLDLEAGGARVIILNKDFAEDYDIHVNDRVKIFSGKKSFIALVNITRFTINAYEVGLFREVWSETGVKEGSIVLIKPIPKPESLEYIKKKLDGEELSKKEIYSIIKDVVNNTLSSVELATFISAVYSNDMTIKETACLTKAIADYGQKLSFNGLIVDKHCIGGVPNNRTTPILVSILACAGLKIPKLSSRAISSAAGTADTMEVFCNVSIPTKKLKSIVDKIGACIAWGGAMKIAYADDELIRIRHPMSLDPTPLLLSSIMAKKKAAGSNLLLVDIPFGPGSKIVHEGVASDLARKFVMLGDELGIKTEVVITDGSQPIGNGIGPALEARDILSVLLRKNSPKDLEKKSVFLAGRLLEMSGKARVGEGEKTALKILDSGKALKKFREIIKAQGGDSSITPERINVGKITYNFKSSKSGVVSVIDNKQITKIARAAGVPKNVEAGVYLRKHVGDSVSKGETLFTIHATIDYKLDTAVLLAKNSSVVVVN